MSRDITPYTIIANAWIHAQLDVTHPLVVLKDVDNQLVHNGAGPYRVWVKRC